LNLPRPPILAKLVCEPPIASAVDKEISEGEPADTKDPHPVATAGHSEDAKREAGSGASTFRAKLTADSVFDVSVEELTRKLKTLEVTCAAQEK